MTGRDASALLATPAVVEREVYWRIVDYDLTQLEALARTRKDEDVLLGLEAAELLLWLIRDDFARFWGVFQVWQDLGRRLRETLGVDHPLTEEAELHSFDRFRYVWVWKQAMDRVVSAITAALDRDENPIVAATEAFASAYQQAMPAITGWYVQKVPNQRLRQDALVDLAARLLVPRAARDTGIRLGPSQTGVLLDEAGELGHHIGDVLRENLPGAVHVALSELSDPSNLRALRTRAMALVAPRPGRLSIGMAQIEEIAASHGDASAMPLGEEMASAEEVALADVAEQECIARLEADLATLPPGQQRVLRFMLDHWRDKGWIPTSTVIARALGLSPSTVRVDLLNIRRRLGDLHERLAEAG
jgi:hypothetical protein